MLSALFNRKSDPVTHTVLLLADDTTTLATVQSALPEEVFHLRIASTIEGAIQLLETIEKFNLIIVDLQQPEVEGTAFMEKLHIWYGKSAVPPTLFVLDNADDELVAKTFVVKDILPKPLTLERLQEHIAKLIADDTAPANE